MQSRTHSALDLRFVLKSPAPYTFTGIRRMNSADLKFAVQSTSLTPQTYSIQMAHDPDGSFVAERRGERVGCITTVAFHHSGQLSNLFVSDECRRFGVAAELISRAIAHLESQQIATMWCDCGAPDLTLYEKFGFVTDWKILSFRLHTSPTMPTDGVQPLSLADADALARYDARRSGENRRELLRLMLRHGAGGFAVAEKGRFRGYVLRQEIQSGWRIGPCLADSEDVAALLLTAALNSESRKVAVVSVPEFQSFAVQFFAARATAVNKSTFRMRRGPLVPNASPATLYAVGGSTFA